jgi:hypothetical protein
MTPKPKLRVESEGRRHFITVPSGLAGDLHTYLRRNGVRSAPPEPQSTDVDNIELARDADVPRVQNLLDAWG